MLVLRLQTATGRARPIDQMGDDVQSRPAVAEHDLLLGYHREGWHQRQRRRDVELDDGGRL